MIFIPPFLWPTLLLTPILTVGKVVDHTIVWFVFLEYGGDA